MRNWLGGVLGLLLVASLVSKAEVAQAGTESITVRLPSRESTFSLPQLQAKLKQVTVTIDDPVYKKKKTYDGFVLQDLLRLAGWDGTTASDEVVFVSKDGYAPNTSFEKLLKHRAVVAFREHGQAEFEKVRQGKAMVSPAPFYVVWEEGAKLGDEVPWPYQLAKIQVVNFRQEYAKLYPASAEEGSAVKKGFLVFKNHCLRCHSVNLQGGDVGPELNAPQNVTEYWAEETLRRFIRDASSFRYRSKMPAFPRLKEEEIGAVLEYLRFMKGFKVLNGSVGPSPSP